MYTNKDIFKTYTITFVRDEEFDKLLNFTNFKLNDFVADIGYSERILIFESELDRAMFKGFLDLQMFRTDSYILN